VSESSGWILFVWLVSRSYFSMFFTLLMLFFRLIPNGERERAGGVSGMLAVAKIAVRGTFHGQSEGQINCSTTIPHYPSPPQFPLT